MQKRLQSEDKLIIRYRTKKDPKPKFSFGDIVEHVLIPGKRFRVLMVAHTYGHEDAVLMSHDDAENMKRRHLESLGLTENKAAFNNRSGIIFDSVYISPVVELVDYTSDDTLYEVEGYNCDLIRCHPVFSEQNLRKV